MSLCCNVHTWFLRGGNESWFDRIPQEQTRLLNMYSFKCLHVCTIITEIVCSLQIEFWSRLNAVTRMAVVINNYSWPVEWLCEKSGSRQRWPDCLLQCILATHTLHVMSLRLSPLAFLWTSAPSQSNEQQQFVTCSRQVDWTMGFTVNGWSKEMNKGQKEKWTIMDRTIQLICASFEF